MTAQPRSGREVAVAYGRRAREYAQLLGSMEAVHEEDRRLVEGWALGLGEGARIVDAGCGPGHWTAHLAALSAGGLTVRGTDPTAEFVEIARAAHPGVRFDVGALEAIDEPDGALDGVLAWYSMIHHEPAALPVALTEVARVLRPGGGLLLGFFTGERVEPFDHAVTTAYRWPPRRLAALLDAAGFDVVATHERQDDGHRPHGAISAVRVDDSAGG